jgi:hypothetical protein
MHAERSLKDQRERSNYEQFHRPPLSASVGVRLHGRQTATANHHVLSQRYRVTAESLQLEVEGVPRATFKVAVPSCWNMGLEQGLPTI